MLPYSPFNLEALIYTWPALRRLDDPFLSVSSPRRAYSGYNRVSVFTASVHYEWKTRESKG